MPTFSWPNGCSAAISLTYDDAYPAHREVAAPAFDALGLRGTFYTPASMALLSHAEEWRAIAAKGHELGNHTIFHPCRQTGTMHWLDDAFDMKKYSLTRMEKELEVANGILTLIDGKTERTFAATCGHVTVGDGENEQPIAPLLARFFPGSRTMRGDAPLDPMTLEFQDLRLASADGATFEQIQERVEKTIAAGGWTIFMSHNIGTSGTLSIDTGVHQQMIEFLAANQDRVWVAPVVEVVKEVSLARMKYEG